MYSDTKRDSVFAATESVRCTRDSAHKLPLTLSAFYLRSTELADCLACLHSTLAMPTRTHPKLDRSSSHNHPATTTILMTYWNSTAHSMDRRMQAANSGSTWSPFSSLEASPSPLRIPACSSADLSPMATSASSVLTSTMSVAWPVDPSTWMAQFQTAPGRNLVYGSRVNRTCRQLQHHQCRPSRAW